MLSGINHGANVGRAVLHSGTVGAALTAGISDARGLAVSLAVALHPTGEPHWASATAVLPPVLDLLLDSPEGTVLSLNVPDLPVADLGPLRHAVLARGGAVQARVDEIRDGDLHLGEIEVSDEPEEGTGSALLRAGHPTLTALRSVQADDGRRSRAEVAGRPGRLSPRPGLSGRSCIPQPARAHGAGCAQHAPVRGSRARAAPVHKWAAGSTGRRAQPHPLCTGCAVCTGTWPCAPLRDHAGSATDARSSGSGGASATTRSTARHSMCRAARCISCTVAVSPGRHTASTQASANGLGPGPVTAQLVTFSADAAAAASTRFSLRPLVENISRTSPGRAWARTCRAYTWTKP